MSYFDTQGIMVIQRGYATEWSFLLISLSSLSKSVNTGGSGREDRVFPLAFLV